jgi:ABC-type polysaccharide transport system permease subunit
MKNKLYILIFSLLFFSCSSHIPDIKEKGYNYTIIDTTHVAKNGFNHVLYYQMIIKIDDKLYSASGN